MFFTNSLGGKSKRCLFVFGVLLPTFQLALYRAGIKSKDLTDIFKGKQVRLVCRKKPGFRFPGQALIASVVARELALKTFQRVFADGPHQAGDSPVMLGQAWCRVELFRQESIGSKYRVDGGQVVYGTCG
jgi:hypothetical protein